MPGALDHTFDAPYVQDPMHKLLYGGKLFSVGIIVDSVPDGGHAHMLFNARTLDLTALIGYGFSGNGHVHAYEVTSWTAGSAINPSNNYTKYQGVNSISGLLIQDPTSINVQVGSEPLWSQFVPGGTKVSAVGNRSAVGEHFIVEAGKTILIEFSNHAGTGGSIGFGGVIHETPVAQLDDPD